MERLSDLPSDYDFSRRHQSFQQYPRFGRNKENGRKTLPILAGRKNAVQILSWVFAVLLNILIGIYIGFEIVSVELPRSFKPA